MNIVITGASRGIGKAIAIAFIKKGWNLAICSLNKGSIQKAANELQSINPEAEIVAEAVDVREKASIFAFAQNIERKFSQIDVLVNNAGIFIPGSIHEEKDGIFENTMYTNLHSAYHLTRALLPKMKSLKTGHIINICSTASLSVYANGGSYSISKHALLGFSKNLREELKPFNIKVTAVCPGPTLTDSWAGFDGPAERLMAPEDVAKVVWNTHSLSHQTVVEDIVMRPIKGDMD